MQHPPPAQRLTRQRKLVLDILQESDEHLDAETIFQRARARDQAVSLATIYRALAYLKQHGLIDESRLGEEHGHFEARPASPHFHFTCSGCGKVFELQAAPILAAIHRLGKSQGLAIDEVSLHLSGICPDCRAPSK